MRPVFEGRVPNGQKRRQEVYNSHSLTHKYPAEQVDQKATCQAKNLPVSFPWPVFFALAPSLPNRFGPVNLPQAEHSSLSKVPLPPSKAAGEKQESIPIRKPRNVNKVMGCELSRQLSDPAAASAG